MIINPYAFATGGGGGGFDPLDLSPSLWLDASDASTLYDATSGGSLVAADGSVARWEDKSGNARHATQSTSGSRPTRKTSIQNSLDIVRFDGASDHMPLSSSFNISTGAIFAVAKGSTKSVQAIYANGDSGAVKRDLALFVFGAGSTYVERSDGIDYHGVTQAQTTGIFNVCFCWLNSSSINAGTNGSESSFSTTVGGATSDAGCVGASIESVLNHYFDGDIAEILVFDALPDSTDRAAVRDYLNAKWDIY